MDYGKVDNESLALLLRIHSNKMHLCGTKYTAVVDHEPFVALYNSHYWGLPFRIAKNKLKLGEFDFKVAC